MRGQKIKRRVISLLLFHTEFSLRARSHQHVSPKSMPFNGTSGISRFTSILSRRQSKLVQCCLVESRLAHKFVPLSELQTILTVLTFERTGESEMEGVIILAV